MFSWLKLDNSTHKIREDRRYLAKRARRLLQGYLDADAQHKEQYYEVVSGAAAGCQPTVPIPSLDNLQLSQAIADAAVKVVRRRDRLGTDGDNYTTQLITDAYATVAVAHRRAAALYSKDPEMQQLGTAAVHLVTMATSYMTREHEVSSK